MSEVLVGRWAWRLRIHALDFIAQLAWQRGHPKCRASSSDDGAFNSPDQGPTQLRLVFGCIQSDLQQLSLGPQQKLCFLLLPQAGVGFDRRCLNPTCLGVIGGVYEILRGSTLTLPIERMTMSLLRWKLSYPRQVCPMHCLGEARVSESPSRGSSPLRRWLSQCWSAM